MTREEELLRHIADEEHWNCFVAENGGELVAPLISRPGVQNADYLFRNDRVLVELKTLRTEYFDPLIGAIGEAAARLDADPTDAALDQFEREMFSILEKPLKRIIKKANRQLRETKQELGLENFRGLILCINDGFIGFPPSIVAGMFSRILARGGYSSVQGLVYLTNHAIRFEADDDPSYLWWRSHIDPEAGDDLHTFTDALGRKWGNFVAGHDGLPEPRWRTTQDLRKARIIGSPTPND